MLSKELLFAGGIRYGLKCTSVTLLTALMGCQFPIHFKGTNPLCI